MTKITDDDNFLTPREIMEKFPTLQKHGWTQKFITEMLNKGLLRGRKFGGRKEPLIELDSVFELVRQKNNNAIIKLDQ